jgi:hypothetical protein
VAFDVVKRLRFTDILSRTTRDQGIPGSGEMMNYLMPALAGMWMDGMVYEALLQWQQEGAGV